MASQVDLTIIGGGPVGLFGAFYAGLRGMSVRIIDSLPQLGGQLMALYPEKYVYDMPGFPEVLAKDLANELTKQAMQFDPEVVLNETASGLVKTDDGWVISTEKGEYPTKTIMISAGNGSFSPTKIGIETEEEFVGKGVFYGVQNREQFAGKDLIIVGGGDSAFDWALNLQPIAKSIKLVHRRDVFRAHEDTVEKVKKTDVELVTWAVVKEIKGSAGVESVVIENTQSKNCIEVVCDAVIVNIGFKSSLGPIKDWGVNILKNQISVNDKFETGLPGIFAVGDVCTHDQKLKLIATGVGEAATAVCIAKTMIDPSAKLFPGHSSDMEVPASTK